MKHNASGWKSYFFRNKDTVRIAAETFADSLRQRQSRGQCDDDLLIFLSADDHTWTSLGAVTKRYLSDDVVSAVTSNAESYFEKEDYLNGIRYMVDSYTTLLKGEPLNLNSGWSFDLQEILPSRKYATKFRPSWDFHDYFQNITGWHWPIPHWAVIVIGVVLLLLLLAFSAFVIYRCVIYCKGDRRAEYTMGTRM
ncbi:hypothetical protein ANCDUO_01466 [Ancylostoma duodenale]|uniref:Uncharacterized protein n=1 Tax=Ancylostoma duodenale TaxID=51022 RepID=A0A0C2H307_9BILA|nr:hypothetical protein ANCDUO_01466 [Ancylostoma duodenale]